MSELATEVIMTLRNRTNKYGFLAISSLFLSLSCFAQTGKDTLSVREETLDEVVVTGYVNKPKEIYTGSVFTIDSKTLKSQVNTNLLELIKNNVPGFELTPNNNFGADPNKLPDMVIRGRSSFIEGDRTNLPLFILDGVEVDVRVVFNLKPSTISQISVLKDAAATTYYGSKAANGVIVITSLPTRIGKLDVDYTNRFQISVADLSDYNLLNAAEKLEFERKAGLYGNFTGSSDIDVKRQKDYYEKLDRVKAGINTNWLKIPLRTGLTQTHNVNVMGGTPLFRYTLMAGINDVRGVMDKSDRRDASVRVNLTYGDFSKLFLQYTARIESGQSHDVPYGSFADYAQLNPYDAPYNNHGELNTELAFGMANPIYEKTLSSYIEQKSRVISNSAKLRWNVVKHLRLEGTIALTQTQNDNETFFSPRSVKFNYTDKAKRGSFDILHSNATDFSANAFAVWSKAFKAHQVIATLGLNLQATENESNGFTAIGILSDKIDHASQAATFAEGSTPKGGKDKARMFGGYLNVQYIFENKYFIDASFRREGSSKFGTSERYAPFSMIALGWNLHKERFLENTPINLLKIRTSIGTVGNVSFSPYQAQLAYRYHANYIYNNEIGAMPVALVNPNLKWERTTKANFGLDFSLFADRLSGSFDIYKNTTNNLVMTVSKPLHTGFANAKENLGQIRNSGYELSLRGRIIDGKFWGLNAYVTASHNRNRIVKISDYLRNQNAENAKQSNKLPVAIYAEGESLTALKVMRSAGINPANGKEIFVVKDGKQTYTYNYNDRIVVGDLTPTLQGAFGLAANAGNFSLSVSFTYRLGATIYNATLANKVEGINPMHNVDRRAFYNRWQNPGDNALYKHIAAQEITPPTSRFVKKEYALDGTSLMLGYDVPNGLCQLLHIQYARLTFSMGQFLHLSTIKRERGLAYPFANIYELGLNIKI